MLFLTLFLLMDSHQCHFYLRGVSGTTCPWWVYLVSSQNMPAKKYLTDKSKSDLENSGFNVEGI